MTRTYAATVAALHGAILRTCDDAEILSQIRLARSNVFPPEERLAVYTHGYVLQMRRASATDYPALAHHMGEEACEVALDAFVRATPSPFWDLNLYPIGFARFLRGYSRDAAAHCIADLESAITEVFWLPDSAPLDVSILTTLSLEALAGQVFSLRHAARLLHLEYAGNAYLKSFRNEERPTRIDHTPEYLCVLRHRNEVHRLPLEREEYLLLTQLNEGVPFGSALEEVAALPDVAAELLAPRLTEYLSRWLRGGIFRTINKEGEF
jgi:hypothetical protein